MENNQSQLLELLREEYANCSKRIDDFNAQLVPMFNTILFIIGGYLALTQGSDDLQKFQAYTPYLLFTALGLAGYQYRRTLILQGYRLHLEGRINGLVGANVYNFASISKSYLLRMNFFSVFNGVSYFAVIVWLIVFSSLNDFNPWHLAIQIVLFGAFVAAYLSTERLVSMVKNKFDKELGLDAV